jgi:hypothetical protein
MRRAYSRGVIARIRVSSPSMIRMNCTDEPPVDATRSAPASPSNRISAR